MDPSQKASLTPSQLLDLHIPLDAFDKSRLTGDQLLELARRGEFLNPVEKGRLTPDQLLVLDSYGQKLEPYDLSRLTGEQKMRVHLAEQRKAADRENGADDRRFMKMAVDEARKSTAEDERHHPKVGAVVVKDGQVVATAYRGELRPGDHAEYTVLEGKLADEAIVGATVYVTLEPCTTRSADKVPCVERLIRRRVKKVVIGMLDPNQEIRGRGVLALQKVGIEVQLFSNDLVNELFEMNRNFIMDQEEKAAVQPSQKKGDPPNVWKR